MKSMRTERKAGNGSKGICTGKGSGRQVNEALEELRMNKAELALRMSVSRSMMSQYLNRKYRSDATELEEALRGWLREVHPGTEPAEDAAEMGGTERPPAKDGLL